MPGYLIRAKELSFYHCTLVHAGVRLLRSVGARKTNYGTVDSSCKSKARGVVSRQVTHTNIVNCPPAAAPCPPSAHYLPGALPITTGVVFLYLFSPQLSL